MYHRRRCTVVGPLLNHCPMLASSSSLNWSFDKVAGRLALHKKCCRGDYSLLKTRHFLTTGFRFDTTIKEYQEGRADSQCPWSYLRNILDISFTWLPTA